MYSPKPNLHEGDGTCVLRHAYLPMIIPPARIQAGAHKALTFFFHARMGCSFAGGRLPCPWYSIWIVQFSATLGNFTFNAWKLHLLLMETSLFMRWCLEFRIGPCSIYSDLVYLDISGHIWTSSCSCHAVTADKPCFAEELLHNDLSLQTRSRDTLNPKSV